ncbi:hypothetical protein A1O7_00114 [Cladophialophora yegresii CBS 114405]|uniref:Uncharacterized protein n=1 Tax=Cladophialophora yegresii CBS 114405 TaxID=1182544 RepID=W9WZW8_9EURO|nr:uncharacterized protein A1O7_00114 [Cladophialophora yegresii CBS 114405]EXJ63779.1 hypothetical protein A1O7_00114 [Cladophialophora yegresii CBS 114405]
MSMTSELTSALFHHQREALTVVGGFQAVFKRAEATSCPWDEQRVDKSHRHEEHGRFRCPPWLRPAQLRVEAPKRFQLRICVHALEPTSSRRIWVGDLTRATTSTRAVAQLVGVDTAANMLQVVKMDRNDHAGVRADQHPDPSSNINATYRIRWRLLICQTEAFYLHEVPLLSTDRGPAVVETLLHQSLRSESWLAKAVPFMIPAAYTAVLAPVPVELLSDLPCLVDVETQQYSHVLTTALRQPSQFPATAQFLTSYARFAITPEPRNNAISRDAILIKLQLSKLTLAAFLAITLTVSVVAGVVAGVARHSVDLGLGVFGALVSLVGIVEGFATWRLM